MADGRCHLSSNILEITEATNNLAADIKIFLKGSYGSARKEIYIPLHNNHNFLSN